MVESRSHMASLREELHALTKAKSELQKSAAEDIIKKTEVSPDEIGGAHSSFALYMYNKQIRNV